MQQTGGGPRTNHIELAQKILDMVRRGGLQPGARLAEQQLATLCNVSRTPVRAALRLLAEQGFVERREDDGFRLRAEPRPSGPAAVLPPATEDRLAESILRDRAARRLNDSVTVAGLARRYQTETRIVLKTLRRLANENWLDKAPGQAWVFRATAESADGLAESYEFRLLLEPAALLTPGFVLDDTQTMDLRLGMQGLLSVPDSAFDTRTFQRLDLAFHTLVAEGCANRFLREALNAHLRLRRLPGALSGVTVFRLRQSTREHLGMLDQMDARQWDVAADLMRIHLRLSRGQRPTAASRGAPALGQSGSGGRP